MGRPLPAVKSEPCCPDPAGGSQERVNKEPQGFSVAGNSSAGVAQTGEGAPASVVPLVGTDAGAIRPRGGGARLLVGNGGPPDGSMSARPKRKLNRLSRPILRPSSCSRGSVSHRRDLPS